MGHSDTVVPRFVVGQMLSSEFATYLVPATGMGGCGWFRDSYGRDVYICDGSHRDGTRGHKVLQIGRGW
jgi:hypothetical protein